MTDRSNILGVLAIAAALTYSSPASAGDAPAALRIAAPDAAIHTCGAKTKDGGWNIFWTGALGGYVQCARAGKYTVAAEVYGSVAKGGWPEMALAVDCVPRGVATINWSKPHEQAFEVELSAGPHLIMIWFLNDDWVPNLEDRNLYVNFVEIRPPAGAPAPTLTTVEAWEAQLQEEEKTLLAGLDQAIEKNRKEDATVRVTDADGKPVAGARVRAEQVGQEFLCGATMPVDHFPERGLAKYTDEFKKRYEAIFNYGTVQFYWKWFEREKGKPDWARKDVLVNWAYPAGIKLKGHPLLWDDKNGGGIPDWAGGKQPPPEVQKAHVTDVMRHYAGKIQFWEVINEPAHQQNLKINDPYRWAREADPTATLIVNDYGVLADGYPPLFYLVKDALEKKVPIDAVGIQAHNPRGMRFPLGQVWRVLDAYAALGVSVQISEFCPASDGAPITHEATGKVKRGVWDEAAQADYAREFYRVCFAHPAVAAVTWWEPYDGLAKVWWRKNCGLLNDEMKPKPVYEALRKLIREDWRTTAEGRTDAQGRFTFRGFRGSYRVTSTNGDRTAAGELKLAKTGGNELVLTLKDRVIGGGNP